MAPESGYTAQRASLGSGRRGRAPGRRWGYRQGLIATTDADTTPASRLARSGNLAHSWVMAPRAIGGHDRTRCRRRRSGCQSRSRRRSPRRMLSGAFPMRLRKIDPFAAPASLCGSLAWDSPWRRRTGDVGGNRYHRRRSRTSLLRGALQRHGVPLVLHPADVGGSAHLAPRTKGRAQPWTVEWWDLAVSSMARVGGATRTGEFNC